MCVCVCLGHAFSFPRIAVAHSDLPFLPLFHLCGVGQSHLYRSLCFLSLQFSLYAYLAQGNGVVQYSLDLLDNQPIWRSISVIRGDFFIYFIPWRHQLQMEYLK